MGTSLILSGTSAVAIHGRALLIEGPPGSGKSSLALALIDRGASLIGDDGVTLVLSDERALTATPPPNIAGKLEIRGIGIVELETKSAPVALILSLGEEPPRLPEELERRTILGVAVPVLQFGADVSDAALRAEWALRVHGLKI